MTGAEGKFVLEGLDPELLFRLLVYAPGHVPKFSDGYLDPRLGQAELRLEPRDLDEVSPERVLRGRVVDAHGDPVAHAVLEPRGEKLDQGTLVGGIPDVDTLAMSDEHGEFELACSEPGESLVLLVNARAFASRMSPWIEAGGELDTIALDRGVTVTGVVQKDGKPLVGVELGVSQQNRSAEVFLGERTVGTTSEGRFTLVNVPANEACFLYGRVGSFKPHGSLSSRPLETGAPEATADVGVLAVEPGLRLAGHVELADGTSLPDGLRLVLDREAVSDPQIAEVRADGSFAFEDLPAELYVLSGRIPGFVLSPENGSYDFLNRLGLLGRIEGDVRDLVVLFEPGVETLESPEFDQSVVERYVALRKSPLRGVAIEAKMEPHGR